MRFAIKLQLEKGKIYWHMKVLTDYNPRTWWTPGIILSAASERTRDLGNHKFHAKERMKNKGARQIGALLGTFPAARSSCEQQTPDERTTRVLVCIDCPCYYFTSSTRTAKGRAPCTRMTCPT